MRTKVYFFVLMLVMAQTPMMSQSANAAPTWTQVYETTSSARESSGNYAIYSSGYEYNGAAVTNFTNSGKSWDLIRVRMQFTLSSNSTTYYTDIYFDRWPGASLSDLQLPDYRNNLTLNRTISNLVVDSNFSGVNKGSFALGAINIWPYNYAPTNSGISPAGSSVTYDWDDVPSVVANGHGSYQFFNLIDTQTVMAWNMHRYGGPPDLGMGPNSSGTGSPDWTSNTVTWNNTNFKVQVFVGLKLTSGSVTAPAFSGPLKKGVATTLTATANGPGRITFFFQGKRIPNCISRILVDVSGVLTATCNYKPASSQMGDLTAQFTSSDSSFFTSASSSPIKVQAIKRTTNR